MKNKLKRIFFSLTAAVLMLSVGTVRAAEEEISENSSAEETEASPENKKRQEASEDAEITAEQAQRLLEFRGSIDGWDIYARYEDYEDRIWQSCGGKPEDKKAELTSEQAQAKEDAELLRKLGDYVAVSSESGQAAAFSDYEKLEKGRRYISHGGRFLLTIDQWGKAVSLLQVISTLDEPYLFRTADGEKLQLTDSDYKEITAEFTLSGEEDGHLVYREDNGEHFAWLSTDMKQAYGIFRYAEKAENSSFRLLVDDRSAALGLESKETGYIWWSSPLSASQDMTASQTAADQLESSCVLRYSIPEERSANNYLRSETGDCEVTVTDIEGGIRAEYDFRSVGISFPVEYTVEEDYLKASLDVSEIRETKSRSIASEVTLIGSFGAADSTEEGCFILPDGCGAVVNFNNGQTAQKNMYSRRIYGENLTAVPTKKGAVTEQLCLPVYGIIKGENALLAVAAKGDTSAVINAGVSGQSGSSFNICNFSFILRENDIYYMSGTDRQQLTVFERGDIKSDDIEVRYYPLTGKDADAAGIAGRYREYLLDEGGVSAKSAPEYAPLYISLYGGAETKKPVLGVPVSVKNPLTDFEQAGEILSQLKDRGVEEMSVSYSSWTDSGIKNQVDTDAKPSGVLGGKSGFEQLKSFIDENGFEFYPVSDSRDFRSGNGYYSFGDTTVRVSGAYTSTVSYDRAFGIPDKRQKNMSLLSPSLFGEVLGKAGDSYTEAGLNGMGIGSLSVSLYGDYGKKNISRYKAAQLLNESLDSLEPELMGNNANAYVLPYIDNIANVPLSSSRYDMFDEDIPFYQLVLHGVIPYSCEAVNGSAEPEKQLLKAVAAGSCISFDFIFGEASELKDTEYDNLFYANYSGWLDTAAEDYRIVSEILSGVSSCTIDSYETSGDGKVVSTVYSDGTEITVDFENETISSGDREVKLSHEK